VNQQCKLQWKQWLKETKCPTSIRAAAAKFDILYPTLRKHIIKGTATKLLGCLRRTFPMQPIRTKFSICGHVKGWQRSSNFGRNWPILDKTGVAQVTGSAFFLFGKPDDLSTTSHRPISIKFCHETYFDFRGHFTPKSEIENRSNRHLNQKRLQVTECTAERYCLHHTKPLKCTFRWPTYSPGVTSQNDFDFSMWQSKDQRGAFRHRRFPATSGRGARDPKTTPKLAQIFAYGKRPYPYRMQLHGASDLDQKCLKTRDSKDGCSFPPNVFAPTLKSPQNPILGKLSMQNLLYG